MANEPHHDLPSMEIWESIFSEELNFYIPIESSLLTGDDDTVASYSHSSAPLHQASIVATPLSSPFPPIDLSQST